MLPRSGCSSSGILHRREPAARLCAHRDDVDDVVQEAFLQALAGLGRLRDPDRFGAWLAGIIRNISRAAARQAPLMLLADWPEDLHPASAQGLPSAEDLDRAEVVRAAVAGLPGGQRRAPPGDLPVREFTPEDLASRLLGAAGAAVTGVTIDELGPGVLAAQIKVAGPAGTRQVTAPPGSALALAAALDVPVGVADALMDRLAVPVTGDDLLGPFANRSPAPPPAPRSGPRNLAFADGLDGWTVGGSSRAEVTGAHWDDYTVSAADGAATLAAAVPQPYGDVFLRQSWTAGDYRGATVTLRAEVRAQDVAGHAELSLFIITKTEGRGPEGAAHAASGLQRVHVQRGRTDSGQTITGSRDWTRYEIAAQVPADAEDMGCELTLAGPGRAGLRAVELTRSRDQGFVDRLRRPG
jgi:Sigma-70 region 2/Domain of unknown function (DUF151)